MPCYDPPIHFPADCTKTRAKLDITTRLACMFCHFVESQNGTIPPWAQEWWLQHQKFDAERKLRDPAFAQESEIRKQALAKLTDTEKRVLGIL